MDELIDRIVYVTNVDRETVQADVSAALNGDTRRLIQYGLSTPFNVDDRLTIWLTQTNRWAVHG